MSELFVELFSEDLPARMQGKAAQAFSRGVLKGLEEASLPVGDTEVHVTPRRIALCVRGLPSAQPDRKEEKRGPRVGAPEKALAGFLRSAGLTIEQCEKRETPKGEFYYAVIEHRGQPTVAVLPEIIAGSLLNLPWPKSMRWATTAMRYARPLHSIIALFAGEVLPGGIQLGHSLNDVPATYAPEQGSSDERSWLPYGRTTRGHRFLSPDAFEVQDFDTYGAELAKRHVMLDASERRQRILDQAQECAAQEGLKLLDDPALLDEVTGLVEWPLVFMGAIDDAFMSVPQEVLTNSMRAHQKYFSLLKGDALAARFLVVSNMVASDGGVEIVKGNERVLKARLSDAKFFWDQDRQQTLASRVPALKDIVFQAQLGTVAEKVTRLEQLAGFLAPQITGCDAAEAQRAAHLCKADLTTAMVYELPELQGLMGHYYCQHDGEPAAVGQAVEEHYSPLGPGDTCPSAPASIAVALVDKIDSLVGFFAIDEKPTGSKDPYALRRSALGVIRLIVENQLRLPLRQVFAAAHEAYGERAVGRPAEQVFAELLEFFADRLKVHLKEQGVRHDLVTAVFALGDEDDLVRLLSRVSALAEFVGSEDGSNLLVAYRRASNIVRIEEKKDSCQYTGPAQAERLAEEPEQQLFAQLATVQDSCQQHLSAEQYQQAMATLAQLRAPVDRFFDDVTVNADDADLRVNRLHLLAQIRGTLEQVADFSRIEG